jgi:hypothetical protein
MLPVKSFFNYRKESQGRQKEAQLGSIGRNLSEQADSENLGGLELSLPDRLFVALIYLLFFIVAAQCCRWTVRVARRRAKRAH